jgi:glycosyltransferase involved in cell wall biosynthesis
VKQTELLAMRQADAVVTHSAAEAAYLAKETPGARIHVVPWPITPAGGQVPFAERCGVAFIGSHAQDPNPDALHWLVSEIMPRVWERQAGIECLIVGHGWPTALTRGVDPRVKLVGPVEQLSTIFDRVRLCVAPLRFGAGLNGKVLESLAAGVPCVMSPIAAEGIPLPPVLQGLVGCEAQEIAMLICRAHEDAAFNAAVAQAGQGLIQTSFSLEVVESCLREALAPAPKEATPTAFLPPDVAGSVHRPAALGPASG